jgi:hypothetical protein
VRAQVEELAALLVAEAAEPQRLEAGSRGRDRHETLHWDTRAVCRSERPE